jgi:hypothetical protein
LCAQLSVDAVALLGPHLGLWSAEAPHVVLAVLQLCTQGGTTYESAQVSAHIA